MSATHPPAPNEYGSPLAPLAKAVAIGLAGSVLLMGTLFASTWSYGAESSPWVSVSRACRSYDVAVTTRFGTVHLAFARG